MNNRGNNKRLLQRKSIRLKGYDYSQAGLYFITICCYRRACLFGYVVGDEMVLNKAGQMAEKCWLAIPEHFPNVVLHEYIVMPNHIHGIVELVGANQYSLDDVNQYSPDDVNQNSPDDANQYLPDDVNQYLPDDVNQYLPDDVNQNLPDNTEQHSINNEIGKSNRAKGFSPLPRSPSKTVGSIVRGFKIGVTKWMRQNTNIYHVWQRNYYEHIIRNEQSYQRISEYIINNPMNWNKDKFYQQS